MWGVEGSVCALLACCCTPTLGACILSWAHAPPPPSIFFLEISPHSPRPPGMCVWRGGGVWHMPAEDMTVYIHRLMDGLVNGSSPNTCTGAVLGGRKQEQQQRRGRGNVSMVSTEEGPMHHGVEVACC